MTRRTRAKPKPKTRSNGATRSPRASRLPNRTNKPNRQSSPFAPRDIPPYFKADRSDKVGIYSITFPMMQDGKLVRGSYIGQTKQAFISRWSQHVDKLATNQHCNNVMSKAYKTYGIGAFTFTIVERIKPGWRLKYRLNKAEDYHIYKSQAIANERWSTQHTIRRIGHRIPPSDRPDHTDKLLLTTGIIGLIVAIALLTIL